MKRKHVEMPKQLASLLKCAGMESQPPEVAMGVLCGAIAQLTVAVYEAWPEAWPMFSRAVQENVAGLIQVAGSSNPRVTMNAIVETQRAEVRTGLAIDRLDAAR